MKIYMKIDHETFLTNAPRNQLPYYREAIRRYEGPAKIELRDEAYIYNGQPYPECFSVHVTNNPEGGRYDLTSFWRIFYQVRVENGQPGDPLRRLA